MLSDSLTHTLKTYPRRTTPREKRVAAAVLLPLFMQDGQPHLLFTRRTQTVRDHKGQICFPGGAVEPEDATLADAALREAQEEVGLLPADVELLGSLDDVVTHTGFHITPYVGRIPFPYAFRPDAREVDAILTVPLSDLLDPRNLTRGSVPGEGSRLVYFYQSGPHTIWGITGWIVANFLEVYGKTL